MNARELLTFITPHKPVGWDDAQWLCIVRAAKLLAAAEANDGTTPETDHALISASGGAFRDAAGGVIDAVTYEEDLIDRLTNTSRRLELERKGLAARVAELEPDAERYRWLVEHRALIVPEVGEKPLRGDTIRVAIDAARSKP